MRKYIVVLVGLVFNVFCFGQQLPNIIPPSPEATQLAKFVDMPVSLYNGTPNINVPIYTINTGGIQIPISLSYHAKGVQVSEIASRVGQGWTLNAGGVITRQVRGVADESNYGYLQDNYIEDFQTNSTLRLNTIGMDIVNELDYYPDVFMFNFMGYSGKFVFDQMTKKPLIQKYDDLEILNTSDLTSFTIITPDGIQYNFSITDSSFSNNYRLHNNSQGTVPLPNTPIGYPNSWYLTSITTTTNETVYFEYETETVVSYDISSISESNNNNYLDYSKRTCYQKQLKQINFKTGKIVFNALAFREDLSGGHTLDNIEVYYKKSPNAFILLKKFKLNYAYTISNDDNLQTVYELLKIIPVAINSKKRLFLESIEEKNIDVTDNTKFTTSFEYNTIPLPNRLSNAKDVWGYYNGKNNHYFKANYGTDRTIDITLSEAGMLKKINHPTGGHTEFIYEHNKVIPPVYFKNLLIPYNNPLSNRIKGLFKNETLFDTITNAYYETIDVKQRASVDFEVDINILSCQNNSNPMYGVFLLSSEGHILHELTFGDNNDIVLLPGIYKIKVVPNCGHNPGVFIQDEEFSVVARWQEQEIPDDQELLAAGKRIHKIIKKDKEVVLIQKEYLYTDEVGKCSGKVFSIPAYYDIITPVGDSYLLGRQIAGPSSPISDFAGNNLGYSMVTEIQHGDNSTLGKTISTFTVYSDLGEYYKFPYHVPVDLEWGRGLPIEVKQYKYENNNYSIVNKTVNNYLFYGNCVSPAGLEYQCIADPSNSASLLPDYMVTHNRFKIPSYKAGKYQTGLNLDCIPNNDSDCYRTTYFLGGKMELNYTDEYNYVNSSKFTYTRKNYNYDSVHHHQKTSESITNSSNEITETKYFYPQDLNNSLLIGKKMFGIPLKTETYYNGNKLSTQETVYKDWDTTSVVLLLPQLIKTSKGDATLEDRIKYNAIDTSTGNPLEVEKKDGIKTSYIWGYDKTQPVAKLENIAYASIPSALITTIQNATNSATGTEQDIIDALNALRTSTDANLQKAMITTLTYKPLIGVSTITDPKGQKTTYDYDSFGRLKQVKDHQGNILSENKYHYRTQN